MNLRPASSWSALLGVFMSWSWIRDIVLFQDGFYSTCLIFASSN